MSELAVARLVVAGLSNREAAEHLFVSHHTISGHLRSILLKLDVTSRVELARLASLLELDGDATVRPCETVGLEQTARPRDVPGSRDQLRAVVSSVL